MRWLLRFDGSLALRHRRAASAAGLVVAVVWLHALLLSAAAPPSAVPRRLPALDVRQIRSPAVAAPDPAPAAALPPAALARKPATVAVRTPVPITTTTAARPPVSVPRAPGAPTAAAPTEPNARPTEPAPAPADDALAPTHVPPSAELVFALQRGAHVGQARLSWQVDGERYALAFQATLPSGREVEQHSQGGFDAAGLAPSRLADRRRGRDVRAANFQREHGKVTFSGPRWELPLHTGTQDRLSWLVQLVALAGGAPDGLRDGAQLAMWVVGARGAASHWRFEVRGVQRVSIGEREAATLWLVREPVHPYDVRVEVWLDPQRGHWPLKLRQTQVPGGEPLEWLLRDEPLERPGT